MAAEGYVGTCRINTPLFWSPGAPNRLSHQKTAVCLCLTTPVGISLVTLCGRISYLATWHEKQSKIKIIFKKAKSEKNTCSSLIHSDLTKSVFSLPYKKRHEKGRQKLSDK